MFNQINGPHDYAKLNEKLTLVKQFSQKGDLESLIAAYVILKNIGKQNEEDKAVRGWKGEVFNKLEKHIHNGEEVANFLKKIGDELKQGTPKLNSKL